MKAVRETKQLGELCRIRTGKKDVNQGSPEGVFPFFTCAAEHTFSDSYSFDTEALLIAGNGNVGQVSYYNGKFEAYQRTYVISDFENIEPRYLYLILDGKLKETVSKQKLGNTMPYIKVGMLSNFLVPLPPIAEQQRIVEILDAAFAYIATAKANAEKNLQNARAIFEGHLFSIQGDQSFLGAFVDIKTGKLDANAATENGQYPFFTCAKETYSIDTYAFDQEAILLAGNNAVGDFNVKHYDGKFNAYQRTYVISISEESKLSYRFLYYQMLKSLKRFKEQSVGAGTKFLKLDMIKNLEILLPDLKNQYQIVLQLDSLLEETQSLESIYQQKLTALDELKKSLLHQAFSGQL
jgi:type I restriction enzyme S subunit